MVYVKISSNKNFKDIKTILFSKPRLIRVKIIRVLLYKIECLKELPYNIEIGINIDVNFDCQFCHQKDPNSTCDYPIFAVKVP